MSIQAPITKKEIQKRKLAFLGPLYSYHYLASVAYLDLYEISDVNEYLISCSSFDEIFSMVSHNHTLGIIAVHNSIAGDVFGHEQKISQGGFINYNSVHLPINHALLAKKDTHFSDLTEVLLHPQVQVQTSLYLQNNPSWKQTIVSSTSLGAKIVSEHDSNTLATVGSQFLAEKFDLEVLTPSISNQKNNHTEFIVFG